MTDHRHTLATFLRTDRYRLEAALEGRQWDTRVAGRITDYLRYALQVQAVYLEGVHPHDGPLRARLDEIAPASTEEAMDMWQQRTEALLDAIQETSDARLHAPVLDAAGRNLSVLGHLYDLCRASAALLGWLQASTTTEEDSDDEVRVRDLIPDEGSL